ncbi:AFG1-like ATPase [Mycobacteroides abscessus]|nr:AFG1-like ATPase [Mycobacteroides abscessus]
MSDPQSGAALCLQHLADRHPTVSNERLIAQLVPPPTFSSVSFDSYRPDPNEPTQTAAVEACRAFAQEATTRRAGKKKLFGKREVLPGVGIYLDGGFGVGKTPCWRRSITRCPALRRLRASVN